MVVIAEGSGYWSSPGLTVGRSPTAMVSDRPERSVVLDQGLHSTVDALRRAGLQVALVKPTYTFDNPANPVAPRSCSLLPLVTGRCPSAVPVSAADPHQEQARTVVDRVALDTGAGVLDVREYRCPAGWCGAMSNGVPVYMDTAHLSAPLSALLSPEFGRAIAAAG